MKIAYELIREPLLTEKTSLLKETAGQIVFLVDVDANKQQIKDVVERSFKVGVEKVRTLKQSGKLKRQGRYAGHRADYKKAIVTLKDGDKISYFEGA